MFCMQTMKQIIPLQYYQQEKGCSSNHTNVDFRLVTYDVPTRAHQRNLSNYIRWKAIFWCVIFLVKYERASFVRQGLKSRKAFALSWFSFVMRKEKNGPTMNPPFISVVALISMSIRKECDYRDFTKECSRDCMSHSDFKSYIYSVWNVIM